MLAPLSSCADCVALLSSTGQGFALWETAHKDEHCHFTCGHLQQCCCSTCIFNFVLYLHRRINTGIVGTKLGIFLASQLWWAIWEEINLNCRLVTQEAPWSTSAFKTDCWVCVCQHCSGSWSSTSQPRVRDLLKKELLAWQAMVHSAAQTAHACNYYYAPFFTEDLIPPLKQMCHLL